MLAAPFYYFAELAQIKSTDSELAVQMEETEPKVRRVRIHHPSTYFVLHNHTHLMHNPYTRTIFLFVFSRQVEKLREYLEPLRADTPLVSINASDAEIHPSIELDRGPSCAPGAHAFKRR